MKKAVLITNIPAHYRIALFNRAYLKLMEKGISFTVIFSRLSYKRRKYWNTDSVNFLFGYYLLSKFNSISLGNKLFEMGFSISRVLKKINPDIVIISGYSVKSVLSAYYCIRHNIPYLIYTGETKFSYKHSNIRKKIRRFLLDNCAGAVVYGKKAKEFISNSGVPSQNIYIAINSIDTESFLLRLQEKNSGYVINPLKINFLYTGELREYKGLNFLIDSFSLLSEKNKSKCHLNIVGGGKGLELMKKYASSKGLNNISFHGKIQYNEIEKFYLESDVFVFPSLIDNFGMVLVEAACAGMAIMGSEFAGGSYDLIIDGYNGLLFNPKDKSDFSAKLEYLIENPEIIIKFGNNSKKLIDEKININKSSEGLTNAIIQNVK